MTPSLSDLVSSREAIEHLSHANAFASYVGNGVCLCRTLGRYLLYVSSGDIGIACHLMAEGYWESWVTLAMLRTVQPGWRCVDVGAHAGYYSVLLADLVGPGGHVDAFEPNPETFALLDRNRDVNGVSSRLTIHQLAAGRESRRDLTLYYPARLPGSGSVIHRQPRDDVLTVQVDMEPLDALIQPPIHFMKIDAEAADHDVLEGALRLLDASPGVTIFFEHLCCYYLDQARAKLDRLTELGFPLAHIDFSGDVVPITREQLLADPWRPWNLYLRR